MVRWLVVGANGMLGSDLVSTLANRDVRALGREECDVTNLTQVQSYVSKADVVVNCAAYTAVDDAESNADLAFSINSDGAANLATACRNSKAKLIQISTDYVFSGLSKIPYSETDETDPKSIYGASKLSGEKAVSEILPDNHYIVRTAWLYGKHGNHFGKTMLKLSKTNETLNVVCDQVGQPTWTKDLSLKLIELVENQLPCGIYHGTASGQVSWYHFAQEIFKMAGLDASRIKPIVSSQFSRPASRPAYSVLGHDSFVKNGISPIRNWKVGLEEAFGLGVFDV